jgi:cytochrome c peroxidase
MALMEDPEFKKWVLLYAKDQKKFYEDFALAFGKLIELGVNRNDTGFSHLVRKAAEQGKPLDKVSGGCPFAAQFKQGKTELDHDPRESKL